MKRIYILVLLLSLAAALPSCRKDAPELMNPGEAQLLRTPSQVFKAFWHGMNNSYGFWDIDPTDWDRVYDEYLPLFEALDGADPETEEEAAELFGTMQTHYTQICGKLIDHHLSITFYPESEYEFAVSPGYLDISARDYFHDAIIGNIIPACIEANRQAGRIEEFVQGRYEVEGDSDNMAAISYKIDGVIYLRFSGFAFQGVLQKDPGGPVEQVLRNYQRMLLETPDIKGVIIDVRDNGGGLLADMQEVLAPMIDTDLLIGYTRVKEGLGRLDYGPWVPCIVSPAENHRKVEAPIVVLANLHSVSMSEMTCMAVSVLPNGCVVGERTFGGTGPLYGDYKFAYSGAWENSAVSVYGSTAVMKDARGKIHEGVGIVPHIEVLQTPEVEAEMRSGVDPQLERALEYIRTGK